MDIPIEWNVMMIIIGFFYFYNTLVSIYERNNQIYYFQIYNFDQIERYIETEEVAIKKTAQDTISNSSL